MKNLTILLSFIALTSTAQVQFVDLSTPHTNSTWTAAQITIPGVCTNAPYNTTNYIYITYGDNSATAWGKYNSSINYLTNQLLLALQLPNQINTNLAYYINANSNRITVVAGNLTTVSNLVVAFPGANINTGSVNSNKLDSATLTWLDALDTVILDSGGNGGTTLHLKASDDGSDVYLHVTSLGVVTATSSP